MKRLCIYLTYDKKKTVDEYIGYMLKELKTVADSLAVVCNETEIIQGEDILKRYADEIFCRENKGFDAGGFKDALCGYLGWDKVLSYDELILVNDSIFGPFRSMKSIFDEMDEKDADFWGLGKHEDDLFPETVQSYFLVIRSGMLHDYRFREYWEKMPYYGRLGDVVSGHEVRFTAYFSGLGYTYDVLGDMEINASKNHVRNNYLQYAAIQYELIKKRNFPFLKRQPVVFDNLYQQTQENLRQAINYIDKHTEYDAGLIWDNIIRTFNMADLQRSFHIQYILPEFSGKRVTEKKVVFLVFVSCGAAREAVLEYLEELAPEYDVRIYSEESRLLEEYRKRNFSCHTYNRNGLIRLFLEYCDYDYVCVLHDADVTSEREPGCAGKSYLYNIWENLVKNKNHISGILQKFEEEKKLGFLTSPQPFFSRYFEDFCRGWDGKFEKVARIASQMGLQCNVSEDKPPFRVAEDFWIRGFLFKRLKDIEAENYPFLQYIWTYIAQEGKFYSGIVESVEYASMNEVNLSYYLKQIAVQNRKYNGRFGTFIEMKEKATQKELTRFCEKYSRIFVYGAGYYAKKYGSFLKNAEAYIVSDGQEKPDSIDGTAVKYLSDIAWTEECGVVVCVGEDKQMQVVFALEAKKVKHYFCI